MELIIGPRLYSTWSLRPWLVLKRCRAEFSVREIDIYAPEGQAELERISPSRLVPLLRVDGQTVWDSMAISVWCAERYPETRLWPTDPHARWLARSAAWGSASLVHVHTCRCQARLSGELDRQVKVQAVVW